MKIQDKGNKNVRIRCISINPSMSNSNYLAGRKTDKGATNVLKSPLVGPYFTNSKD